MPSENNSAAILFPIEAAPSIQATATFHTTAAAKVPGIIACSRANARPALPLHLGENLNMTITNAQHLSDLRRTAVTTARDNADLAHENDVLREQLREAMGRAYYAAAQKFAGLERDWIAQRRGLLVRLDRYGDLTEDEEVELVAGVASTRRQHDQAVAAAEAQGLMVRAPDYVAAHGVGLTAAAVVAGTRLNAATAGLNNVNDRTGGVAVNDDGQIKGIGGGGHANGNYEIRRDEDARVQLD